MRLPLISVVVCLLAVGGAAHAAGPRPADPRSPAAATVLPDQVLYWHVLRHVVALDRKADAMDKKGQDGTPFRQLFQLNAGLNDAQARRLAEIAEDCVARVAETDRKAREIIVAARTQVSPGEQPLPPPSELVELQRERDAVVLAARDELRHELGDEDFSRFDKHVRKTVVPSLERTDPRVPSRSAAPRKPALLAPKGPEHEVQP